MELDGKAIDSKTLLLITTLLHATEALFNTIYFFNLFLVEILNCLVIPNVLSVAITKLSTLLIVVSMKSINVK